MPASSRRIGATDSGRAVHLMGPLAKHVLRIAPPLTMTEAEARDSIAALAACFANLRSQLSETSPRHRDLIQRNNMTSRQERHDATKSHGDLCGHWRVEREPVRDDWRCPATRRRRPMWSCGTPRS